MKTQAINTSTGFTQQPVVFGRMLLRYIIILHILKNVNTHYKNKYQEIVNFKLCCCNKDF